VDIEEKRTLLDLFGSLKIKFKNMSKKNIMVLRSDNSGVGFFRSLQPHINLEKLYPDEFHCEMYTPNEVNWNDDDFLKRFDLIHYHRTMCDYEQMPPLLDKLKKMGTHSIMDLDDFFFFHTDFIQSIT